MAVTRGRSTRRTASKGKASEKGGLGRVSAAAKRQQEKKEAGSKKWIKVPEGESVVLRVLDVDEDFKDIYVHRVPFERDNGSTYHLDIPCLDQDENGTPCPGCKDELDRRYKFFTNTIVRDWEDPENESAKPKDQLMILSGGITLAKLLNKKHQRAGLRNRDIEIEREGTGFDTEYTVEWADDENVPLTAADKKLAENSHDLSRYVKIPDYDDFYKSPKDRDNDDDVDYEKSAKRASPFKGERKGKSSSRSTASKDKPAGLAALKARKAGESKGSTSKKTVVRRRSR